MLPECAISIPDQICGCLPIRRGFPQVLRHTGIGRRSCHVHMNHLPRPQFDDEESKKWSEEKIGHLQKITGPHPRHLCRMITQECFPRLSSWSFSGNHFQILLDGPFDFSEYRGLSNSPRIRLNTLGSPKSVVCCLFLDQRNCL